MADVELRPATRGKSQEIKLRDFDKLINYNADRKISLIPVNADQRSIPQFVVTRLETASRSVRYSLPLDLHILEQMTPLEYISSYTHLYSEQRTRYQKIFKKFKHRVQDIVEYNMLYLALNSMFCGYLSKHNFHIVCIALFIDELSTFDINTFVVVCAFCDRLYWTSYLDGSNTFNYWAPNRSVIEVLDFENLKWKLYGVNVNKVLQRFLFSLG